MSDEEVKPLKPVEEPLQHRWTVTLAVSAFACVIGSSFQVGYSTGVLNAPEQVFRDFYNETYIRRSSNENKSFPGTELTLIWSLTVSIFCIGGMLGGLSGGFLSSKLGRKKLMLLNNALLISACTLMFLCEAASSYEVIIIGRSLTGLHAGMSTVVAPLYLMEIAPLSLKGAFGTLNQLAIVIGVMVAQIVGLREVLGSKESFIYLLVVPMCPAVLQVLVLAWCPESPYWLRMYKRDISSTRKALTWLRSSSDISSEMSTLSAGVADEDPASSGVSIRDFCTQWQLRTALAIALCMQLSQQLSGINAVTYYSTSIFHTLGINDDYSSYGTLGLGGVTMLMTCFSVLLVDSLGRRVLHLSGLIGMLVSLSLLTASLLLAESYYWTSYVGCTALVTYMVSFGIGPGSIPWFITAELFEHSARPYAVALANFVNWFANFLVGISFPIMQDRLAEYAFVPFIVLLLGFSLFTYFVVPETKNRTVAEVASSLKLKD